MYLLFVTLNLWKKVLKKLVLYSLAILFRRLKFIKIKIQIYWINPLSGKRTNSYARNTYT